MPGKRNTSWWVLGLLLAAAVPVIALWAPGGYAAPAPSPGDVFDAVSMPCKDRLLAFPQPGKIAKVLVDEGSVVKADAVLAEQDDSVELMRQRELKLTAEMDVYIKAAAAQLDQRVLDYERMKEAQDRHGATTQEVEHARLDQVIADWSLKLKEHEQKVAQVQLQQVEAQIARMKLRSPVDGRVERIMLREGEAADLNARVMRVVQTDPLWIDVPVRLSVGRTLHVGQAANVLFPDLSRGDGKVIHVSAVAEAGSDTLRIRVEVPNPQDRRAGERVKVGFLPTDAPVAAAATQPAQAATAPATPTQPADTVAGGQ